MEESEIDRWIGCLGTSDYAVEKLETFGLPALHRLFQAVDGAVAIPAQGDPRDSSTGMYLALGRLGARYPEELLALVQGRTHLKLGLIQALGSTGDGRLKAIAKEALKNLGNDW
jgi:hypothetical protein